MKILISGFEPFGEESINPSWEAVKLLPSTIDDIELIKVEIPVVRYTAVKQLAALIEKELVDVVICVGQSGGSDAICVERVGINIDDYRIGDNDGNQPIDEIIIKGAPTAYFSNLPIKKMVHSITSKGISAKVSDSAGTYVCNHVLFSMCHLVNTKYPKMKAGFIHIPFVPNQVKDKPNTPSMELEKIVEALTCAIQCISHEDM